MLWISSICHNENPWHDWAWVLLPSKNCHNAFLCFPIAQEERCWIQPVEGNGLDVRVSSNNCDAFDLLEWKPKTWLGYWTFTLQKLPECFSRFIIRFAGIQTLTFHCVWGFFNDKICRHAKKNYIEVKQSILKCGTGVTLVWHWFGSK